MVGRQLFVDQYLIASTENTTWELHTPQREGIALLLDQKWEGSFSSYFTVILDNNKYRMYYRGQSAPSIDSAVTCYAESNDGITWHKPALGIHSFDGSTKNNIILRDNASISHNFTPFIDTRPHVPRSSRFKAVAGKASTGVYGLISDDGKNWKRIDRGPLFNPGRRTLDSQNVAFWSASEQLYLLYYRVWRDGVRSVARSTSRDFLTWSPGKAMKYSDTGTTTPSDEIYTNGTTPYFRAPQIYLALAKRYFPDRATAPESVAELYIPDPRFRGSSSDAILMSSRGGTLYERAFVDTFIPPGNDIRDQIARSNAPALGIVPALNSGPDAGKLYLYRISHYAQSSIHLTRYSLRLDGFASLSAGDTYGEVTTRYFKLPPSRRPPELELNFSTGTNGFIEVFIETSESDYTTARSIALTGDHTSERVTWADHSNFDQLADRVIRMRFRLKNAKLFSFNWSIAE